MFLTHGDKDLNELPSATNPAHWAEQQNLSRGTQRVTLAALTIGNITDHIPRAKAEEWPL